MTSLLLAAVLAYHPSVEPRLHRSWGEIAEAAGVAGVDPELLAGLIVRETRVLPVRGGKGSGCWGSGQVCWIPWGKWLRERDTAHRPEDLLDERTGTLAAALILAHLHRRYSRGSWDRALCIYGCGNVAMKWTDCVYSREVRGAQKWVRSVRRRS